MQKLILTSIHDIHEAAEQGNAYVQTILGDM